MSTDQLAADRAALAQMLRLILDRAGRPTLAGSTEIAVQQVPAALLDQARALLKTQGYARLPREVQS
jgi:hypothetical protein